MESKTVKKIALENNLTLVVSDLSRRISQDACIVKMRASIDIDIKKELFSETPLSDFKFEEIREALGDKVMYEYKIERNFIMDTEKDKVFETLVKTFLDNMGQYVAKSNFPEKFVLKKYKDWIKQQEKCHIK